MGKHYVWAWGYDGTIMFVYEVYQPKFRRCHKLRKVKYFYTDAFNDVQTVAEQFIDRLEQPTNQEEE